MGNKASRAALKDKDLRRFCDASRCEFYCVSPLFAGCLTWVSRAVEVDEVRALYGQFLTLKGVDSGEDMTMNLR